VGGIYRIPKVMNQRPTGFVWENGRADGARPHAQGRGDVGRLRVSGQMLAQAALVDVVLAADWAGVGRRPALDGAGRRRRDGPSAARQAPQAVDDVRGDAQAAQRRRQTAADLLLLLLCVRLLLLVLLRRQERRHRRRRRLLLLLLLLDVMGQRWKETVLVRHQERRSRRTLASRTRSFTWIVSTNHLFQKICISRSFSIGNARRGGKKIPNGWPSSWK